MFKNLLLVALRNFKKDKWYSLLNILGLTIGITFSLLLIFYIKDELSYDRYNENGGRLYRIASYVKEQDKPEMKWAISQFVLAPALKKDYPEVEEAVRMVGNGKTMYKNGDLRIYEDKIFTTDSNYFRVFTQQFIEGDPKTALIAPRSIVVTQTMAEKFFGAGKSYLGKSLENDKGDVFKITGVIKDVPKNSHLVFNALISISTLPKDYQNNWGGFGIYNYVLLKPNTNPQAFEKKMLPMYDKYMAPIFAKFNVKIHYGVQKVTDIHLHSDLTSEPEELGNMSYIYTFATVAFFMLLIACINYMNLATARSARRAKEIGIRKVTGSSKSQLIAQFLIESGLMAVLALVLSMGAIAACLGIFNQLSGKFITFGSLLQPGTFFILLGVILFVGLVGGSYPAFYLSGFNPLAVLKGKLASKGGSAIFRKILVVKQFALSICMLVSTFIVFDQLQYMREVDLGFDKQQVLSITANANGDVRAKIQAFREELRKNPQILSTSTSQAVPGASINFNLFSIETNKGFVDKGIDCYAADEDYFKTLGIKISKGRNFNGAGDTLRSIIVNENMAKYFGWDQPIGKRVKYPGDTSQFYLEVVGVIKDFNQKSLYNPITPLMIFYTPNSNGIQVKVNANNIPATVASIEATWNKIFPELPFSYTFLDQDFDSQYAADQKRGKIFTAFSVLTIAITCLGLLGLIAFTTEQRQKEISIRKILGAGLAEIIPLITRNFVFLVGISCIIAFPVAYFFMHSWLKIFPYNTGLSTLPFICSALIVLAITLLTVTFHTVKASLANPTKSLRAE